MNKLRINIHCKTLMLVLSMFMLNACMQNQKQTDGAEPLALKDAYKGFFLIGTALNVDQCSLKDSAAVAVVTRHFNSIVAENCMKSMYLQPENGKFFFDEADQFVKFGEENNMFIVGHTLIWHSQAPVWLFVDGKGNDVTRDTLIARMKKHITTVVTRYKGRVNGWDVVNEAFNDDGSFRNSKFYDIIGKDYIKLAFQFAHEADPEAELYYNDYSMPKPAKQDAVIKMVNEIKAEGIKIDGIGMQAHYTLTYPDLAEFDSTIKAFASTGCKVMLTELDITVIPAPDKDQSAEISKSFEISPELNPYPDNLPDSMQTVLSQRYADLFKVLIDNNETISRVTVWGVNDGQSWRNYWPVKGRKDYPLLFDREYKAKPVVDTLINLTKNI